MKETEETKNAKTSSIFNMVNGETVRTHGQYMRRGELRSKGKAIEQE